MRLSTLVICLLVAMTVNAQLSGIIGAVKGITALSGAIAKLVGTVLPSGLLLPFAAVGPLKFSLPMLFALKGLGFLKFNLMLAKISLLAPVGAATAKFALLKAKYRLGKTAAVAAGKGTFGIMQLPVKLTAMKMGAIAGANAGAKAGLARYKMHEKATVLPPMALPTATDLFSQSKGLLSKIPMRTVTVSFKSAPVVTSYVAEPEPAPEPEPELQPELEPEPQPELELEPQPELELEPQPEVEPESQPEVELEPQPELEPEPQPELEPEESEVPAYGYKPMTTSRPVPAYTPAPPAYTPAPPAYTPAPSAYDVAEPAVESSYSRRSVDAPVDLIPPSALRGIFQYVLNFDVDRCVQRLVCELAIDPELAGNEFVDVPSFIEALDGSDATAPWMPYRNATFVGKSSNNPNACHDLFTDCRRPTEVIVETAKERLSGADF